MDEPINILVVDDDDVAVESVVRNLRKSQIRFPVVGAGDGLEALAILRNQHPRQTLGYPRVVFLDLNMPRMNGFEFLDAVRKDAALKSTVIFVLTTSDDDRDISRAYHDNVAGYLVKAHVGPQFAKIVHLMECYAASVRLASK